MERELHPLQLGEDVVGRVERAVPADIALEPAQDAERREQLVRGSDLLALAPKHVRVETRERSKPFYVDLASPACVRVLRRALGRADAGATIRWTEMLPAADQLWLADAQGRRYTSELRLVAVDGRAAQTAAGRPTAGPAAEGGAGPGDER